jgi:hypothetical protein
MKFDGSRLRRRGLMLRGANQGCTTLKNHGPSFPIGHLWESKEMERGGSEIMKTSGVLNQVSS